MVLAAAEQGRHAGREILAALNPIRFATRIKTTRVVSKHVEVRPRARLIEVSSMTEGPYCTTCGRIGLNGAVALVMEEAAWS